jgi:hypothetical protein
LTREEARKLGLKADKEVIALYPQWVQLKRSWSSKNFILIDSFFKGLHEELLLEKDGVRIRAINSNIGTYKKGSSVPVVLEKFLAFDSI